LLSVLYPGILTPEISATHRGQTRDVLPTVTGAVLSLSHVPQLIYWITPLSYTATFPKLVSREPICDGSRKVFEINFLMM
jgi:hypothetical protein